MALSTLLLPSSSSTDTADSRRQQQHHSTRKKKPLPPPSSPLPPPSLSPAPRTPSRRVSKKSPAPAAAASKNDRPRRHHHVSKKPAAAPAPSSWEQLKSLLSCRSATAAARVHDPAALANARGVAWSTSLCSMRDVAVDGASSTAASVDHRDTAPLNRSSRRGHRAAATSSSSTGGGHPSSLRGLSGCYECRAINVGEPVSRRYPRPRELCPCSQCGEVFTKADSLEQHQAIRHAVSELGPEDSGRNIVEIIFKSSWQKRDRPICQIDRILKVHNRPRTVARFEAYRDAVRARCRSASAANAAGPSSSSAAANAGNGTELLRFHPAGLACALGAAGSASLCSSAAADADDSTATCGVCAAIRHGFAPWVGAHPLGVRTTASSGRAHDVCGASAQAAGWRAMLVCRVIAGQVRREDGGAGGDQEGAPFDSVAGEADAASSAYGTLEELFVANPRAILPCFVVIYRVDAAAQ